MHFTRLLFAATAALVLASLNVSAKPVVPGVWAQTSSTAGDCPNCQITITERTPHIIEITANNQWVGYAYYSKATDNYIGAFEWKAGSGSEYEDVVFKVEFVYEGSTLTMKAKSDKLSFNATFRRE